MKSLQKTWCALIETGRFPEPDVNARPESFMCDDIFFKKLQETTGGCNKNNWYAQYQPGFVLDDIREGEDSVSDLWKALNPEGGEVPGERNFYSLP